MDPLINFFLIELVGFWSPIVVLAAARPFGFAVLFAAFAWGNLANNMIRMAFVVTLALPVFAMDTTAHSVDDLALPYLATLIKELIIGGMLGFVCSIPLAIAISAGGILDFYRGAFMGPPDPSGGQSTVLSSLFAIIALWFFASLNGFWIVASVIYESYAVWPVQNGFPQLRDGLDALFILFVKLLTGALILAGPLLLLMFISDIAHLVSTKFGKQINITHMLFSTKNILLMLLLPLYLVIAIPALKRDVGFLNQSVGWLELVLR